MRIKTRADGFLSRRIALYRVTFWARHHRERLQVMAQAGPYIVALGGTLRANSSTEKALRVALRAAEELGARTLLLGGADIDLPMYAPERPDRAPAAQRLVDELRKADGVIIGSPGYHGGISGLVKNAVDYVEDMRTDPKVYLEGKSVGLVVTAAGWQATVTTLTSLRAVVHALRGWPTPLGVAINTIEPAFDADGNCIAPRVEEGLKIMAREVVEFARMRAAK
jgi:FMN reductase